MIRDGVALGLGIAVGVVVAGAAIYYVYNKKKNQELDREAEASRKFADKLKNSKESGKSLKELLATQAYVDLLTTKELTSWFRNNQDGIESEYKMIISIPTEDIITGLGYSKDIEIDPNKNVLQMFYDGEKKKVLKIRLVNFTDIESNLQAHLIEEDGMLVVSN